MDQQFQTSFIPKKPLTTEASVSRPRRVSILNFIATVIFFFTLVVSGGLYFYKSSLAASIENMKSDLEKEKQTFDYETIETINILDKRIDGAKDLISNHIAVTPLFDLLESISLQTIQYTKFEFAVDELSSSSIVVKLSGIAPGYKSIGLQEIEMAKSRYINNPIFTNLLLGDGGEVSFDVSFSIDREFLKYANSIEGNAAQPSDTVDTIDTVPSVQTTTNTPAADTTPAPDTSDDTAADDSGSFFGNPNAN